MPKLKKKRTSLIFSNGEIEEMERRKKWDYSDKRGIFANKLRKKLEELINIWFPREQELRDLIKRKGK